MIVGANKTNVDFELESFDKPTNLISGDEATCESILRKICRVYTNLPEELKEISQIPFSRMNLNQKKVIVNLIEKIIDDLCITVSNDVCRDPKDNNILIGRTMTASLKELKAIGIETNSAITTLIQRKEVQHEILLVPKLVTDALERYKAQLNRPLVTVQIVPKPAIQAPPAVVTNQPRPNWVQIGNSPQREWVHPICGCCKYKCACCFTWCCPCIVHGLFNSTIPPPTFCC